MKRFYIFNLRYEKFHVVNKDNWQLEEYSEGPSEVVKFITQRQHDFPFETQVFESVGMLKHFIYSRCIVYVDVVNDNRMVLGIDVPKLRFSHNNKLEFYSIFRPYDCSEQDRYDTDKIFDMVSDIVEDLYKQHKSTVDSFKFYTRVSCGSNTNYP